VKGSGILARPRQTLIHALISQHRSPSLLLLVVVDDTQFMKMKTQLLFSASTATSSVHTPSMQNSRLLNNDDQLDQYYDGQVDFDLSQYSIQFNKCQTIKQYDGNYHSGNTILSTKRFVIFRLCPDDSCDSNYGEYLIDLDSYLYSMVPHMEAVQEQYCEDCNACMGVDDDATCGQIDLDTCSTKCKNIANMESNGYVDAAEYTECGKVYYNQNTGVSYYAGAMCSSSGTKIKIGLFADDECSVIADVDNIDHYIKNENGYNVKLSYHLLKQTFSSEVGAYLTSCAQDGDVNQVCQSLYEEAGKCESPYGFVGMANYEEDYSTQLSNENEVCEFISNIKAGEYDQRGEIVLTGITTYASAVSSLSDGQIFALTFFAVGSVGLVLYAVYLRRKIVANQKNALVEL
jgi:hypothetical protein